MDVPEKKKKALVWTRSNQAAAAGSEGHHKVRSLLQKGIAGMDPC